MKYDINDCELWKVVKFKNVKENMYEVSNFGNLRNRRTDTVLHPWIGKNGYRFATLMCDNNKPLHVGMHTLVAIHFIPIPENLQYLVKCGEKIVPNHKDFNKLNNFYRNLEWTTYQQNNDWNIMHNHCKKGDECPWSKTNNDTVHLICQYMEDGYTNKQILSFLGKDKHDKYYKALLTNIRTGKHWKHISSQYKIEITNTLRHYNDEYIHNICKLLDQHADLKTMRNILNVPNIKEEKEKFKKLVWFIKNRKSYKYISDNYNWWKDDERDNRRNAQRLSNG